MIRVVIENVLLFIAPTALYIAYVYLVRRTGKGEGADKELLADAPVLALCLSGAAVVLLVMLVFGSMKGGKPSEGYEPPVMRDGKIVPGHQQ